MLMDKSLPGQHFHAFVKLYIDTLKKAVFSQDDPSLKYNSSMFITLGEEVDYSFITDKEK